MTPFFPCQKPVERRSMYGLGLGALLVWQESFFGNEGRISNKKPEKKKKGDL